MHQHRPAPNFLKTIRRFFFIIVLVIFTAAMLATAVIHVIRTDQTKSVKLHLPLPVEVLPAKVRTLQVAIGASGTVQPSTTIVMTARVSARVLKVPVDLGIVVKPDDSLVELDDRMFIANLDAAKANEVRAEKQLQRMIQLEAKNYGSPADTEKARADAASAHQALVQAQIDLDNTQVKSPASAVVLTRTVNPGEITKLDQELFQLGTIESVMMVAEVSVDKIGFVHLGMRGEVGTDAFPGETFTGEVVKIEARVSALTRTFGVYIRIANKGLRLKPGVTGYARLGATHTALAVAGTALINPVEDRATVFVIDKNDIAHIRQVRRGLMVEGMVEILDGLQEGERVVTVGQLELRDNDRVRTNPSGPWNAKK